MIMKVKSLPSKKKKKEAASEAEYVCIHYRLACYEALRSVINNDKHILAASSVALHCQSQVGINSK